MWWKQGYRNIKPYKSRKGLGLLYDSKFQWSFTTRILLIVFSAYFILTSVQMYFISQNFSLFINLAYNNAPNMVTNLEMEKRWISYLFLINASLLFIVVIAVCLKESGSLIFPMFKIKQHLRRLTRGDWSQPEVKIRNEEDYDSLVNTYNYFYKSLQRHTEVELQELQNLKIPLYANESKQIWENILSTKMEQLTGFVEDSEKSPNSHHAS